MSEEVRFIELTLLDEPVFINVNKITSLSTEFYCGEEKTMVGLGGDRQMIDISPQELIKLIDNQN